MQRMLRVCALVAALLLVLAACDNSQSRIVGKWSVEGQGNPMVWEFAKNGAVKSGNIAGKYGFVDSKRLQIKTQFATMAYSVEFGDKRMIWTDSSGARTELKKIE